MIFYVILSFFYRICLPNIPQIWIQIFIYGIPSLVLYNLNFKQIEVFTFKSVAVGLFLTTGVFFAMFIIFKRFLMPVQFSLVAILLAPVCEEYFFRGIVFNLFPRKFAVVGSAIVFSIWHLNLLAIINSLIAGCLLGLLYEKYRSVKLCVVCHFAFNVLSVIQKR